jgi:uncharacterized protein YbjT (DUF2867 family)
VSARPATPLAGAAPGLDVLVTGGTGYLGTALVPALLARGHRVRVLARPASVRRVPPGAQAVAGDALRAESVAAALREGDTLVHLVGTPSPGPLKAREFKRVDLASIHASVEAAVRARAAHVVYVSVAAPAPVMRAYGAVRAEGERLLRASGLPATILRPWYVLGPGHRWPLALKPFYFVAELLPATRAGALRLGLLTLEEMVAALVCAVEAGGEPGLVRTWPVPELRQLAALRP